MLYDLAFLLMDLDKRGLRPLANRAINRWLDRTGDDGGLALLPLFLSQRACVRAKVVAASVEGAPQAETGARRADAAAYLDLALAYLHPRPPRLIAVGGWSGSGKSALARALAPEVGPAPGAVVIRSDVIRKQRAGIDETARLPPASYTPASSAAVYAAMADRAARVLSAGHAAIADAVFRTAAERAAIEAVATTRDMSFDGLWLEVPLDVAIGRVIARRGDASDADGGVVQRQYDQDPGLPRWRTLDSNGPPGAVGRAARDLLQLATSPMPEAT